MELQFLHVTPCVRDIEVSKRFYTEVVGLRIIQDFGAFVLFEGHFTIHDARAYMSTAFAKDAPPASDQGRDNLLVYFESKDLEGTFARVRDQVKLIHPIAQQHWGQKVFRFHDPDGHIVEIGEPMPGYARWAEHLRNFDGY